MTSIKPLLFRVWEPRSRRVLGLIAHERAADIMEARGLSKSAAQGVLSTIMGRMVGDCTTLSTPADETTWNRKTWRAKR